MLNRTGRLNGSEIVARTLALLLPRGVLHDICARQPLSFVHVMLRELPTSQGRNPWCISDGVPHCRQR
jgi:hypothetical protein